MNPSRSSSAELQDLPTSHGVSHDTAAAGVPRVEAKPTVGKLFARLFGAGAAEGRNKTFAATEWQATEWQETRSPPAGD